MTEIPLEIQMHAERLWDEGGYQSPPEIIAGAILAERDRCISLILDAANAGRYTPLSELVTAIRGEG